MYIAMNRFKVGLGHEHNFEQNWLNREVHLKKLPGFISFQFLKGKTSDDHTLYVSHTLWNSYEDFVNWTNSEEFKLAHAHAPRSKGLTVGPPCFEGYDVLQNVV